MYNLCGSKWIYKIKLLKLVQNMALEIKIYANHFRTILINKNLGRSLQIIEIDSH